MRVWFIALALLAAPAQAADVSTCGLNLTARFDEGAPRDRFTIKNESRDGWSVVSARLDLAPSRGGLIFDTEDGGDGVEVFQPFAGSDDSAKLRRIAELADGGDTMLLDFMSFAAGERYAFTIDVDDTAKASDLGRVRVAGGEIEGARLRFTLRAPAGESVEVEAMFANDATATVAVESGC